ncbi:MAG: hypothetical protein QXX20_07625 [Candidatus Thermoplasmatota archaeon]
MNDPKIKLTDQRHELLTFLKHTTAYLTTDDVSAVVKKAQEVNIDAAHTDFFGICKNAVNDDKNQKQGAINV